MWKETSANKEYPLYDSQSSVSKTDYYNGNEIQFIKRSAFQAGYEQCQKEYEDKLRWIPVEEKLPETYSKILATIKSPECTWVEEIGFGEGRFQLPGRGDTDFVTHWMYVPEPPSFLK